MNIAAVPFRAGLARMAPLLLLLAGCASTPHKMGAPLEGLEVKPPPSRPHGLRPLAHQDVALLRTRNTQAVLDAVDVANGQAIMFDAGSLPRSADYDFAAQIASATAELFRDRFGKVVEASSLDDAARKGLATAAVLDLQVYDSNPARDKRGYFFRTRLALYLVDVKTHEELGEAAVTHTLRLSPAELEGDAKAVTARENKLLNQALARTFLSLADELDPRLGTTQKPVALPPALAAPPAGATSAVQPARPPKPAKDTRRARPQLVALAKKLRELDELRAYGMISEPEYGARKQGLLQKYRRYLN